MTDDFYNQHHYDFAQANFAGSGQCIIKKYTDHDEWRLVRNERIEITRADDEILISGELLKYLKTGYATLDNGHLTITASNRTVRYLLGEYDQGTDTYEATKLYDVPTK
jgi:hypothetical protein